MSQRVCLITCATSGIGRETARALAELGATTIIVGRDPLRTQAVVTDMGNATRNQSIDGIVADLSSQRAIHDLVACVRSRCPQLHVLVNNAGGFQRPAHAHG